MQSIHEIRPEKEERYNNSNRKLNRKKFKGRWISKCDTDTMGGERRRMVVCVCVCVGDGGVG